MGGYHSSKDNEEQNLAYEEMLQLLNKSIEATEKIEELQESRIQQCEQEHKQKENYIQKAVDRQKQALDEYEKRCYLKELEEAAAEAERYKKQQQDTARAMAFYHQEYLRKKEEKKTTFNDFGEKQVSDLQLREDWRRKMEEELSKIEQTKVELEKQKQRQQEVVNQKIEEELNRIAIENALKSMEEEDDGNASKETAWKSAGTAKKEAKKKKRGLSSFPGSSPSTPFLLLQEKSLLTKRKEEPVDIKPATLQSKSRTAKQWAIPTRVLQTSSEPTPSEAIAKSPSDNINLGENARKRKE